MDHDFPACVRTRLSVAIGSLVLVGCSNGTPSAAYNHAWDKLLAAVPLVIFDQDLQPCFRTINGEPSKLPTAECYRFAAPQPMRGLAITGFEAGYFYPGWTHPPPANVRTDFRLQLDDRTLASGPMKLARGKCSGRFGCTVYLDFIGRRTAVPGSYGHMGAGKHIVIVDRVIKAKLFD